MHSSISTRKLGTDTPLVERLGKFLLPIVGWKVEGLELLNGPKYVLVVAPHTSNWDVLYGLICAHSIEMFSRWKVGYLVKSEVFRWPLIGKFIHWTGGIPIERRAAQDVVGQVVQVFEKNERLLIGITPEGTRSKRDYWKTGFYRIAVQANVPLALTFIDYKRRAAGFGKIVIPTGDIETDFEVIREFFSTVTAKFPEQFGEVRPKPDTP
jgi:1-acyl-sn-glycerol-3-phosphate acyltransferase